MGRGGKKLLGLLAGSAAISGLPLCGKLAEMIATIRARSGTAAFVAHSHRRRHLRLADEVVGKGQRRAQEFSASRGAILGERVRGGDQEIGFGDQALEGLKRAFISSHTSMVRQDGEESERSLFFVNALFRQYRTPHLEREVVKSNQMGSSSEMRPSEKVAKAVIEAALEGAEARFRPCQNDGSHDFDLWRSGFVVGAVEVTSSAVRPRKALMAAIADGRKGGCDVPGIICRSSWLVELLPDANVNRVRGDIDEYLAAVESERLERFLEADASTYPSVERITRELRVDSGWAVRTTRAPNIRIFPPADCGWVNVEDLQGAVEHEANKEDNRRKLANSGATERHLFVYIDPTNSSARSALINSRVTDRPPQIPIELTHVWAATEAWVPNEFVVIRAERLRDWQLFRVTDRWQ